MRTFGTQGPVNPHDNYIVTRSKETADFIERVKSGKYIVIFAPRQTGKTTFFQRALDALTTQEQHYFPIQLNFDCSLDSFNRFRVLFSKVFVFFYEFRRFTDFIEKTHAFGWIGGPTPYPRVSLVGGGFPAPLENCPNYSNFEEAEDDTAADFYRGLYEDILEQIENVFEQRREVPSVQLADFLENNNGITDHRSMRRFFRQFAKLLPRDTQNPTQPPFLTQRVVLLIDEFDGIPRNVLKGFLHSLRHIYVAGKPRSPHSVGIVGVKNIRQLNYDTSVSSFNIQDEFVVPNFTLEQVRELLSQYTDEVGQLFAPDVIQMLHKQTAGQPFLINRAAQILTEELDVPKTEMITRDHFTAAHKRLLLEKNTNIEHLTTNIRKSRQFERLLMQIMTYEEGIRFNPHDDIISELTTYGVIQNSADGRCEIVNPIYLHHIMQTFTPTVNGLERDYFAENTTGEFQNYLTPKGHLEIARLLDNFRDFITRVGFKILQVPETPQEYVGRHLLLTYLDSFVKAVGGVMSFEVPTGAGKMDLCITHNQRKYIVETKIWRGDVRYQIGKQQLAVYLKSENVREGYYVVFDHRQKPEPRVETETVAGVSIRSYIIPVIQAAPSNAN